MSTVIPMVQMGKIELSKFLQLTSGGSKPRQYDSRVHTIFFYSNVMFYKHKYINIKMDKRFVYKDCFLHQFSKKRHSLS